MQTRLKRIAVIGGGPVGWLAATYLNRMLNRYRPGAVDVIVLECDGLDDTYAVAPGSALLTRTLGRLGVTESSFLLHTEATFMHGSRYTNWLDDPRKKQGSFYVPMDRIASVDGVELGSIWLADRALSPQTQFAHAVSIQPSLCERSCCPKLATSRPFEAPVEYGYQVHLELFARHLRRLAMSRGVQAQAGRPTRYARDDSGSLLAVHTDDGRRIDADFFVDCVGSAMRELDAGRRDAFMTYDRSLLCDRMLTIDLGPAADGSIRPYFHARAATAGWIGESDLATCRRIAYVYSSGFNSDIAAGRELESYLHVADDIPRVLARFEPGRRREFWQRNCLALGQAAGAMEPLVASELGIAANALETFVDHLPSSALDDAPKMRCNEYIAAAYDAVRDLSVMHYRLTRREDTSFWRANRHDIHVPDRLRQDLDLWLHRLPSPYDRGGPDRWCGHDAFQFVLAGMDRLGSVQSPLDGYVNPELASAAFRQLENMRAQAVAVAPNHGRYIRALRERQIELDLVS